MRPVPLSLFICSCLAAQSVGAEIVFEPEVTVGVSRTDNVRLSSVDATAETVLQVNPSFVLEQSAARFNSSVDYSLDGYYYYNLSDTNFRQRFGAQSTAALDRDNLFVTFGARRQQVIKDPSGPIPVSNLPLSGNLTDRDEWFIGPSFRYPLLADVTVSGSYRRSWIRYDDVAPGLSLFAVREFEQDSAQVSLDNYQRQEGWTWAARYTVAKSDYDFFIPWEFRQASLELGTWIGEGLRVFAVGGKESPWDRPFDPSLEDNFWEAGFAKQAGERFSAEFAMGERTFGSSRRASLRMEHPRGQTTLSYVEQPTTLGRDPVSALLLAAGLNDFLSRPGALERYISNRLQWTLTYDLSRSNLSFNVFDEDRTERTRLDGLPLPDESQTGGSVSAGWEVGVKSDLSLTLQRINREFAAGNEQTFSSISLSFDYDLGTRTDLTFRFTRTNDESASGRDFDSNIASLLLTRRFWTPR